MNKKGYTLLEVVLAIFILSIAGTMILTGAVAVIRIMSSANILKDNSNTLLSYAEKTDNIDLRKKVDNDTKVYPYKIEDKFSHRITVEGSYTKLNMMGKNDLYLKKMVGYKNQLIKDTQIYIDLSAFFAKTKETADKKLAEMREKFPDFDIDTSSNHIIRSLWLSMGSSWYIFPRGLLPSEMAKFAAVNPYYIRICYPWDTFVPESIKYEKSKMLIYLSQSNSEPADEGAPVFNSGGSVVPKHSFQIILDPDPINGGWYYYPNTDEKYAFSFDNFNLLHNSNFWMKENGTYVLSDKIKTWEDFLSHIKNKSNGWKKLDKDSSYNPNNIDSSWK